MKLTSGGVSRTAPLVLVADPRGGKDAAAIEAKTALSIATLHDIDALHRAVNEVRAEEARLKGSGDGQTQSRLSTIEQALMQVNMKGSEANLAFPGMLNEQYATFASLLDDADTAPTRQETERFRSLHDQLGVQLSAWSALKGGFPQAAAALSRN